MTSTRTSASDYIPPIAGSSGYGATAELKRNEEVEEENDEAPPAPMDPSVANAMKDLISGGAIEEQPVEQQSNLVRSAEPLPAPASGSERRYQPPATVDATRISTDNSRDTKIASGDDMATQGQWGNKIIPGVTVPVGYKSPEELAKDGKIKDNEEEGEFGEGHVSLLNTFLMFCVIAIVYYALYLVYLNIGRTD